jgi:hypothetical protein
MVRGAELRLVRQEGAGDLRAVSSLVRISAGAVSRGRKRLVSCEGRTHSKHTLFPLDEQREAVRPQACVPTQAAARVNSGAFDMPLVTAEAATPL